MSIARFLDFDSSRRHVVALVLGLAFVAIGLGATPARAQQALPDVDVALVLEVRDAPAWSALYAEVLGTAEQVPKPLGVSVAAGTGGHRTLLLNRPKFEVSVTMGAPFFKIVARGKVSGHEALGAVPPFQLAVVNLQAGQVSSEAVISYGLSSVVANLVELYVIRP